MSTGVIMLILRGCEYRIMRGLSSDNAVLVITVYNAMLKNLIILTIIMNIIMLITNHTTITTIMSLGGISHPIPSFNRPPQSTPRPSHIASQAIHKTKLFIRHFCRILHSTK
jgi:hypothetical protein